MSRLGTAFVHATLVMWVVFLLWMVVAFILKPWATEKRPILAKVYGLMVYVHTWQTVFGFSAIIAFLFFLAFPGLASIEAVLILALVLGGGLGVFIIKE